MINSIKLQVEQQFIKHLQNIITLLQKFTMKIKPTSWF